MRHVKQHAVALAIDGDHGQHLCLVVVAARRIDEALRGYGILPHRIPARLRVGALLDVAVQQRGALLVVQREESHPRLRPLGRLAGNIDHLVPAEVIENDPARLAVVVLVAHNQRNIAVARRGRRSVAGGGQARRAKRRARRRRSEILLVDFGQRIG